MSEGRDQLKASELITVLESQIKMAGDFPVVIRGSNHGAVVGASSRRKHDGSGGQILICDDAGIESILNQGARQ